MFTFHLILVFFLRKYNITHNSIWSVLSWRCPLINEILLYFMYYEQIKSESNRRQIININQNKNDNLFVQICAWQMRIWNYVSQIPYILQQMPHQLLYKTFIWNNNLRRAFFRLFYVLYCTSICFVKFNFIFMTWKIYIH